MALRIADPNRRLTGVIVSKALANALASGRATQLRRPHHMLKLLKSQHTYSVMSGPGKPAECRVTVLEARIAAADDLSYLDARAMGYRTTAEAKAAWVRTYDKAWIRRELIELASAFDDDTCSVVDWLLVKRFDTRWAWRSVQVVTVKRVVDEPRFLADQRRSNAGSYTRSAARSIDPTAECIDEATQRRYADAARPEGEQMRAGLRNDVEAERARRKAERGRSMRVPPYARRAV